MGVVQIIVLIVGVLALLAIYLWDRLRARPSEEARREARRRQEPDPAPDTVAEELAGLRELIAEERSGGPTTAARRAPAAVGPQPEPERSPAQGRGRAVPADPAQAKLLILQVAAPTGSPFRGADLLRTFAGERLEYGAMRIFHRFDSAAGAPLFSIANLVEPGYFDPNAMEEFTTPGLVLLQQLPGPRPGPEAFQAMLATAQRLAERLGGELRDERRNPLTRQRLEALRAEIMEHERRRHVPRVGA